MASLSQSQRPFKWLTLFLYQKPFANTICFTCMQKVNCSMDYRFLTIYTTDTHKHREFGNVGNVVFGSV